MLNLQRNWGIMRGEAYGLREYMRKNDIINKGELKRLKEYTKRSAWAGLDYYKSEVW